MNPVRVARYGAAAAGAGMLGFGGYAAVAWARYRHVDPHRHPRDELDDRFLPEPEVDEYHQVRVRAPAAVTFAAAKQMDIQASPIVKGIFWLRAIPALLRGEPFRPQGSQGIVAETLGQGWGVLAEVPDREIVIGAYTQPWHEHVEFRPAPSGRVRCVPAAFREPGYVKIVWTLAAEPAGPGESLFVTRTRVAATDPHSRTKFRRYWAPISAGIILIRYAGLPLVKKEAERQASRLRAEADQTGQGYAQQSQV